MQDLVTELEKELRYIRHEIEGNRIVIRVESEISLAQTSRPRPLLNASRLEDEALRTWKPSVLVEAELRLVSSA